MNLKHTYCKNFLTSDCFNTNIYGHQNLQHPFSSSILWYVAYTEDCQNGIFRLNANQTNDSLNETNDYQKKENSNLNYEKNEKISISPNPSTDYFKIENVNLTDDLLIQLKDAKGNLILNHLENKINERIDINSLSSGVYFLNVSIGDERKFFKFIKL